MPLSRRTSVQAQEVIRRAYKELESAVSASDALVFNKTTIEDVQKACRILENELGARGLLRNMGRLEPLLKGLECYGKVVDTLCQGTPFLPWIWAPIVTILKIGSDCIHAFETLIMAYSKIGKSLARFENLRQTFDNDVAFQETVAVFYRDVVKFHTCAYKFITVNSWNRFFRTTWGRFDKQFNAILESLDRHGELIDKEANARNIVETQLLLKQLEAERKERLDKIISEQKAQTARHYQEIVARLQVNESDQSSIWETLVGAVPAGAESTCAWALKHDKIASWLDSKGKTSSVWIQGAAGTGKSVIAAHLARFRSVNDHIVIRHFCNDLYESSTKYDQILKSIIRQLAEKSDDAIAYIHNGLMNDRKPLTVSGLEHMADELATIVSGSQQDRKDIWIIIDGIDTCDSTGLTRCITTMDLISTRDKKVDAGSCKILFTSRREPPKKDARQKALVSLAGEFANINESIRLYTVRRLQLSATSERLSQLGLGAEAVAQLANEISNKAAGMFLYARLIIDYLSKQLFRSGAELQEALRELPPELKGFYRKILSNIISHLSPASIESVKCVLQWIGFSISPLKKMELLSAVTFTLCDEKVDRLVPSFFLQDCFALLEERPDKTIGYIHTTVKDFLQDAESPLAIDANVAQRQLTIGILNCLSAAATAFDPRADPQLAQLLTVRGLFIFLSYASKHWTEYVLAYAEKCATWGSRDATIDRAVVSLAHQLQHTRAVEGTVTENSDAALNLGDALQHLQQLPAIIPFIKAALVSQAQVSGQGSSKIENSTMGEASDDAVAILVRRYKKLAFCVLQQGYFLGVSKEDFELFKKEAQTALFTCRLSSCPRSSIGFPTEAESLAHELEHSRRYPCPSESCQFPAFSSSHLLEKHRKKYHEANVERRRLKRVNKFSSNTKVRTDRRNALFSIPSTTIGQMEPSGEAGAQAEPRLNGWEEGGWRGPAMKQPPTTDVSSMQVEAHPFETILPDWPASGEAEAATEKRMEDWSEMWNWRDPVKKQPPTTDVSSMQVETDPFETTLHDLAARVSQEEGQDMYPATMLQMGNPSNIAKGPRKSLPKVAAPGQPSLAVPATAASAKENADLGVKVSGEEPYYIKCICSYSDEDGNTIYCETCDTWQHIDCFYPDNKEEARREDFAHSCADCKPRPLDRQRAYERMLAFWQGDADDYPDNYVRQNEANGPPSTKSSEGHPDDLGDAYDLEGPFSHIMPDPGSMIKPEISSQDHTMTLDKPGLPSEQMDSGYSARTDFSAVTTRIRSLVEESGGLPPSLPSSIAFDSRRANNGETGDDPISIPSTPAYTGSDSGYGINRNYSPTPSPRSYRSASIAKDPGAPAPRSSRSPSFATWDPVAPSPPPKVVSPSFTAYLGSDDEEEMVSDNVSSDGADREVRLKLGDGKSYVTDLDVQTMKRAEAFLNATDAEKGPWLSDDHTESIYDESPTSAHMEVLRDPGAPAPSRYPTAERRGTTGTETKSNSRHITPDVTLNVQELNGTVPRPKVSTRKVQQYPYGFERLSYKRGASADGSPQNTLTTYDINNGSSIGKDHIVNQPGAEKEAENSQSIGKTSFSTDFANVLQDGDVLNDFGFDSLLRGDGEYGSFEIGHDDSKINPAQPNSGPTSGSGARSGSGALWNSAFQTNSLYKPGLPSRGSQVARRTAGYPMEREVAQLASECKSLDAIFEEQTKKIEELFQ